MDKKLKVKWVKALRSGRYKQTTHEMKNADGYCCLGVLRQIMHRGSKAEDENKFILCKAHQNEAGLTRRQQDRLADMNDDGKTFKEIADYIEAKL